MISEKENTRLSKFLSLVLRHKPQEIGIELDEQGWADVTQLIEKMNKNGTKIDEKIIAFVVQSNAKQRFAFNTDGTKIRANQGHSIAVDHGYDAITPPPILYHGTAERNEKSILEKGLDKRQRHHVHLSQQIETAIEVGKRYGNPIVFEVNTQQMHLDGHLFYRADNGVWLTDHVPPNYLLKF